MDSSETGETYDAIMGHELVRNYQRIVLNSVYTQKLEQNEEQAKAITDYKNSHKTVIEGLQVYPLSISENCMVPIGKRAFMKGKLTHTNEVLVFLGDGYFAKYSASQAIALCNRRIAWADEMLKNLETVRNLYEMRQYLPLKHDVFEKNGEDVVEYWTENKLDEWRVKHRQREKEYHEKLAKLREKERTDINTEEDLFKRLDELEIEEELEDESYRLEAERKELYGDDLEDNEVDDESEEDVSNFDQQITIEMIEDEIRKLKDIQMGRITSDTSSISSDVAQDKICDANGTKNKQSRSPANLIQETLRESCSLELTDLSKDTNSKERKRISFVEPCVEENENNIEEEISISQEICSAPKQDDTYNEGSENEDDTIRIKFSHSSHTPDIPESDNTEIQSPVDIYKIFSTPKSILKRSPNDMIFNQVVPPLNEDSSTEDEDEYVKRFVYDSVIKGKVQESKTQVNVSTKKDEKRIVSRFKLERAGKK